MYTARDARIRYYRNPTNIGAMQNWYRVFQLSVGEYFLGVAHDDLFHPDFARLCVEALDRFPDMAVCYTKTQVIDESGKIVGNFDGEADTLSPKPHIRLYNAIAVDLLCIQLLGVMRSSAFRKTREFSGYYGCDRNVLAELSMLGGLYELPEFLLYHRLHQQALGVAKNSGRSLQELQFLDPGVNWRAKAPALIRFMNYFKSVHRLIPRQQERIQCYFVLIRIILEKSLNRVGRSLSLDK